MESSFNLLDFLGNFDGVYVVMTGLMFMVIANLCNALKRRDDKYLAFVSVLFSSLSCAIFILVATLIFPNLFENWIIVSAVILFAYIVFLYYSEDSVHGLFGSVVIGVAISASILIASNSLIPFILGFIPWYFAYIIIVVCVALIAIFIVATVVFLSLVIGVGSAILSKKMVESIARISTLLFYVLIIYTLACVLI